MIYTKQFFGETKDKEPVHLYRLENYNGASVEFTDYGYRIRSICVPDKTGVLRDVCLGYSTIAGYEADCASLGAAIGRHANRIGKAAFTLNGKTYFLEKNDGQNHLHGGRRGFAFRVWNETQQEHKIIFSRMFPDGEDGYPGNLHMKITYEWSDKSVLSITYEAISDQDTVYNVTNHAYFNLEGQGSCSVLNHQLQIFASAITENDSESIPTGKILPVDGTPFDFRSTKEIGRDIEKENTQLLFGMGYDHNFILEGKGFRKAAILTAPSSGIQMTCFTDQPGLQLYTANYLKDCKGKYGDIFSPRNSVCLETQHFPNAVNCPSFPSVVLKANKAFVTKTCYAFGTI